MFPVHNYVRHALQAQPISSSSRRPEKASHRGRAPLRCRANGANGGRESSPNAERNYTLGSEDMLTLQARIQCLQNQESEEAIPSMPPPGLPEKPSGNASISSMLNHEVKARKAHKDIANWHENEWKRLHQESEEDSEGDD